jgi:hypothetical protein
MVNHARVSLIAFLLLAPIGTALAIPHIEVTPLSHDFGQLQLGDSATTIITIENIGNSAIEISSITFTAASSQDFQLPILLPHYLPWTFSAGGHIEVEVTFTPTNGEVSAIIEIKNTDPDKPTVEVTLTGSDPAQSEEPEEIIEDIIDFMDAAISDGTLLGNGPRKSARGRLKALANMIFNSQALIENGDINKAMGQLQSAYKKTASEKFVTGPAAQELSQQIAELLDILRKL